MDRRVTNDCPLIDDYRALIESALEYGNGSHGFDDIKRMVASGECHFWPAPNSVIVTEIITQPRRKCLNMFLAAGRLVELEAMTPLILEWGKENGCTHASLAGRKGWERTFLSHTGWHRSHSIIMEKTL